MADERYISADISATHSTGTSESHNTNAIKRPLSKPRRSQKIFTPHEYRQAIYAHSRRSVVSSSFPGLNYAALADWLIRPQAGALKPHPEVHVVDKHNLVALHNLDGQGPGRSRLLTEDAIDEFTAVSPPRSGKGHLLFLRGHLSPSWVAEVGSQYRLDPEFFCRHLDFFDHSVHRSSFNTPSLASTTNNIIHVYVTTILTDTMAYSHLYDDSISHRGLVRDKMAKYKRSLQQSARCGDSVVREYSILSERFSVIEQRISISVAESGDGWVGVLWMDNGRDLGDSHDGPWKHDSSQKASRNVTALPVIQHHPKMTWRKIGEVDVSSRPSLSSAHHSLPQSTYNLPLEYPSLLSALDLSKRAQTDPFHALIPIFAHAAFSEVAFLNLVNELMDKLTEPLPLDNFLSETFESLQHFEIILERHAAQLRHCVRSIQILNGKSSYASLQSQGLPPSGHHSRSPTRSPPATEYGEPFLFNGQQQQQSSTFTASGILQDYDDLLGRCIHLLSRISSAKTTEMNRAMILESRRAIEQSERVKKLTLLATYFLPLTFTTGLFGMNFNVFGQGTLPVWWYIVFALPITLLAHLLYTWDGQKLRHKLKDMTLRFKAG